MLLCHVRHPDRYVSRLQTIRHGTLAPACSLNLGGEGPALMAPARILKRKGPPCFPMHGSIARPGLCTPGRGTGRPCEPYRPRGRGPGGWLTFLSERLVDLSSACRTRYRRFSGRDSALEAFRHNPTDVASLHWPIGQERNHMSGPAVPLVLSRTAVATAIGKVFNSRVKLTCLATVYAIPLAQKSHPIGNMGWDSPQFLHGIMVS